MNAPRRQQFTWIKRGTPEYRDFYARFAKAAYGGHDHLVPQGYEIDNELSNRNRRVYYNHETNDVVIANRGTDKNIKSDLRVDAMLALGITEQSRFQDAAKHANRTREKYGKSATYTATGHSMGASISQHVSKKTGIPAVTFSAHVPFSHAKNSMLRKKNDNVTNFATAMDPVSAFQTLSGQTDFIVKQTAKSPHALDNFIIKPHSVPAA
jgi:hypothetical protein